MFSGVPSQRVPPQRVAVKKRSAAVSIPRVPVRRLLERFLQAFWYLGLE